MLQSNEEYLHRLRRSCVYTKAFDEELYRRPLQNLGDQHQLGPFRSKFTGDALDSSYQLCDGRAPFSKSMLLICQDVDMIKMTHDIAMPNMLQQIAGD